MIAPGMTSAIPLSSAPALASSAASVSSTSCVACKTSVVIVVCDACANGCAVAWTAGSAYTQLGYALETVAANAVATIFFWGSSNKVLT